MLDIFCKVKVLQSNQKSTDKTVQHTAKLTVRLVSTDVYKVQRFD